MHRKIRWILFVLSIAICIPAIGQTAEVSLAWDPSNASNVIRYRIYARERGESYNYAQPEWQGAETQCTVSGFDAYESYYFVVRAVDETGNESSDSNEVYWNPSGNVNNSLSGNADGGGGGGGCFIQALLWK